jgi:hypothetical protein
MYNDHKGPKLKMTLDELNNTAMNMMNETVAPKDDEIGLQTMSAGSFKAFLAKPWEFLLTSLGHRAEDMIIKYGRKILSSRSFEKRRIGRNTFFNKLRAVSTERRLSPRFAVSVSLFTVVGKDYFHGIYNNSSHQNRTVRYITCTIAADAPVIAGSHFTTDFTT